MADKHGLNCDVRELKLGASFTNNKASQYHTIKYDFKPASVDVNKMATVSVGTKNEVTVTVPHLVGAGVPQTVFKGNQKPYTKECVLIIDKVTGEITLEKLSSNIQVKKTRQETTQKPRPLTPVTADFTNTTQRSTSRTRVATNKRTNPNPGQQSNPAARFNGAAGAKPPPTMVRSPPRVKTSPPQAPWSAGGNSTLASLPMIGLDDALGGLGPAPVPVPAPAPVPPPAPVPAPVVPPPAPAPVAPPPAPVHAHAHAHASHNGYGARHHAPPPERPHAPPPTAQAEESSSSSSSDSGSESDSGSDSDDNDSGAHHPTHAANTNGAVSNPGLPSDVLNHDLCLSESGSDSD